MHSGKLLQAVCVICISIECMARGFDLESAQLSGYQHHRSSFLTTFTLDLNDLCLMQDHGHYKHGRDCASLPSWLQMYCFVYPAACASLLGDSLKLPHPCSYNSQTLRYELILWPLFPAYQS